MTLLEAIILGLVQGLTEFIPVSSSGHLVLLHQALGVTENGLTFDVALHVGTLFALVGYFHRDIVLLVRGIFGQNEYKRVAWLLAAATVPAVISGILLEKAAESSLRSAPIVAVNLILVALLMLAAERVARRYDRPTQLKQVSIKQALAIGGAQALGLCRACHALAALSQPVCLWGWTEWQRRVFPFCWAFPLRPERWPRYS